MLPSLTLQSAMKVAAMATSAAMMEFSRDSDACSTASLMVSLISDMGESYLAGLFRSNYTLPHAGVVTSAPTSAQHESPNHEHSPSGARFALRGPRHDGRRRHGCRL